MPAKFYPAPEVERIARELIRAHHQHLINHNVRMEYLFRADEPSKGGKAVWGTAKKVGGQSAFLANIQRLGPSYCRLSKSGRLTDAEIEAQAEVNKPFFVITITAPVWRRLKDHEQWALVDHELMHCWAEPDAGGVKLSVLPHDFEGFVSEIERHGLWRNDAVQLAKAIKDQLPQPPLFEVGPTVPPVKASKATMREVAV